MRVEVLGGIERRRRWSQNDKFLSGNTDSLDREKPFFNIVAFRKNVVRIR